MYSDRRDFWNTDVVWFGLNITYKSNYKDNQFKTPNIATH